jgi:hypothetical protein
MNNTPKHIVKFVKHTRGKLKNQRRGCVVATAHGVGWSLCNKKDKFTNQRAVEIALARAEQGSKVPVPRCVSFELTRMSERRKRAANFLSVPVEV